MSKNKGNKINDKSKKFKMLFIIFLCISIVMVIFSSMGFLNWLTIFPITVDAKRRRLEKKINKKIKELVKDIEITKEDITDKNKIATFSTNPNAIAIITDTDKKTKILRLTVINGLLNSTILNKDADKFNNRMEKIEKLIDNDEKLDDYVDLFENDEFYIKNMMKVK